MILYFSFNLGERDFSGLPTYSHMFLEEFKREKMVVINIIADPQDTGESAKKRMQGSMIVYDCYLPGFLTTYKPYLEELIQDVILEYSIKTVVQPDYLVEEYLERVDARVPFAQHKIKKVLFVHLLYAGLMNRFTQEPYFEDHILGAMTYLGKNVHTEWKAVVTSDVIICNSKATASDLGRFYAHCGLENKRVYALPLGVPKDLIPYQPATSGNKWAYFGRLDTMKGLWWISKDMVTHKEKYQANPPLICGDGMLEMLFMKAHFFEKLVDYRGLQDKPSLYALLKDVKYCIFPSIYEPYGLALNEAMAMGKICIVSNDQTGMLEQVTPDAKNGIIFDFKKQSVIEFIEQDQVDIEITKRARETARDIREHFIALRHILFN